LEDPDLWTSLVNYFSTLFGQKIGADPISVGGIREIGQACSLPLHGTDTNVAVRNLAGIADILKKLKSMVNTNQSTSYQRKI